MSNKKLTILGLVAVVMIVLAVMQAGILNKQKAAPTGPFYLIQGLDPAQMGSVVLGSGDEALKLEQSQKRFVITNKSNYPADMKKVNDLITKCLDIKTDELYSEDKDSHKDLGVTEENAAGIVKFLKSDSSLLTGIAIGNTKQQGQGTYVRLLSDDKVYLTLQNPQIANGPMDYIDQQLISAERENIASVTANGPNEKYTLKAEVGEIILNELPEGKKVKITEAEKVINVLTDMRFDDVQLLANKDETMKFDRDFICRLKDSTVYTLKVFRQDDKTWVSCNIEFTDNTPVTRPGPDDSEEELKKKEAKLLAMENAKNFAAVYKGWLYEIPSHKASSLTMKLSDLTEDIIKDSNEVPEL